MSTDLQCYSIENQRHAIAEFAERNGYRITRSYIDPGRSGLSLRNRPGLRSLLEDVETGADFTFLLVYDVSRWGRFQDVDESAFYEFRCRRAGVQIVYCMEQFGLELSPMEAIFKQMKRIMAAEYSRELSAKVSHAKRRIGAKGYWQGGCPGLGLRRMAVDANGTAQRLMPTGKWKAHTSERTILVPGPASEVALVREVFRLYCEEGLKTEQIARWMTSEGFTPLHGGPCTTGTVKCILTKEKYVGHNVYGQTRASLEARGSFTPSTPVRAENVFEPIIDQATFDTAQKIRLARSRTMTAEQALAALRDLLAERGRLSAAIIIKAPTVPGLWVYRQRFGGLTKAYELIGWRALPPGKPAKRRRRTRRRSSLPSALNIRNGIPGSRA